MHSGKKNYMQIVTNAFEPTISVFGTGKVFFIIRVQWPQIYALWSFVVQECPACLWGGGIIEFSKGYLVTLRHWNLHILPTA